MVKHWSDVRLPARATRLARRFFDNPASAFVLALVLVALVAALDYASGYELRFSVLYLLPIALATWSGGLPAGVLLATFSSLLWLISFGSTHPYSGDFYFYWEGVAMVAVYLAFVLLLARLRAALWRADERFVRVLDELHAAVYATDLDSGRILYANRNLARLLDGDPHAFTAQELGKRFGLGNYAPGTPPAENDPSVEAGFSSREVRDPVNGRWYLVKYGPIPWKSARRVSLQVISDISAQKHAQALKRQNQDMLHQTARLAALAEVASSLAHELNQPLMAIASYNDACLRMLSADTFERSDLSTALQRSREQSVRAGRIIGRVRDFIRSKRPTPSHFDLNLLLREALELMETQLEDLAVTLDLPETPLTTHADRTLLIQVVLNLMQNAIDAMEEMAPARRQLSLAAARADDGTLTVSVADCGSGIPEALGEQPYIPLFTTKAKGLGLGLSICRSVVEAHGGHIWHEANASGGCTVHFTLPLDTGQ